LSGQPGQAETCHGAGRFSHFAVEGCSMLAMRFWVGVDWKTAG
jgi:hypothetical protein